MPADESTPAIVLRARDYGESDRIVTLLTHGFGKLAGMAKGAKASRQRFERKLEPFSHVILHFRRRPHGDLIFITRAEAADLPQFAIDDDLGKIALGSYMLELADALTKEEAEASDAYGVLAGALRALAGGRAELSLRQAFELKMLAWAGFGLEFARCRNCGAVVGANGGAAYFVTGRGGVLCARCRPAVPEGAIRLDGASAAALARLGAAAIDDAPGTAPAGADGALAIGRFLSSVLDRRLRSAEFLESILSSERRT